MAGASSREVSRHLNTLFHCGAAGLVSDAELLDQFVAGPDNAAEAAFAALVDRHGVMVLGVCRRVLGNRDEAEDAFQATFLVLARKASAIARREQLASWLHGVARRAALDARASAARQKAREKRLGAMLPVEPPDPTLASELRSVLDEELARLPERHRAAIVLCELEGLSRREASARLGISEGTLSSRLARAKSRLRECLTRRGFALSAAALTSVLTHDARAVLLPPVLVDSTIRVATLVAAGSSLAGVVSTSVATLTQGVLKAMLLAKLKFAFLGVFTLAVVSTSVGVLAQDGPDRPAETDRLKAVERKLDRLLEVLGGSSLRTPSPFASPGAAFTPKVARLTPASPPADAPMPPAPPAPPPAPSVDVGAMVPSVGTGISVLLTAPRAGRADLAGRVDFMERRLVELERRFGEHERRMNKFISDLEARQSADVHTSSVPRSRLGVQHPDTVRSTHAGADAPPALNEIGAARSVHDLVGRPLGEPNPALNEIGAARSVPGPADESPESPLSPATGPSLN